MKIFLQIIFLALGLITMLVFFLPWFLTCPWRYLLDEVYEDADDRIYCGPSTPFGWFIFCMQTPFEFGVIMFILGYNGGVSIL